MNEKAAIELVKARKNVRKKFQSLKSDILETQIQKEKEFEPLLEPLKRIIATVSDTKSVKKEPFNLKKDTSTPHYKTSSPTKKTRTGETPILPYELPPYFDTSFGSFSHSPSIQEESLIGETTPAESESTVEDLNISDILEQTRQSAQKLVGTKAYKDYLLDFHELPRAYIDESVRDTEHRFDHLYGIVHDTETEKFSLGLTQKPVEIIGKDIKVAGITYPGTPGLYELLFKKEPVGYKKEDLDNYMDILKSTNAYRRNFDPNEQVQGNGSHKYISIIGPYLQKKGITKSRNINPTMQRLTAAFSRPQAPYRTSRKPSSIQKGTGITLKDSKTNTDYIYWDNVNELVDRLRLLIASKGAGHTGHDNEIISIIEELREARVIV